MVISSRRSQTDVWGRCPEPAAISDNVFVASMEIRTGKFEGVNVSAGGWLQIAARLASCEGEQEGRPVLPSIISVSSFTQAESTSFDPVLDSAYGGAAADPSLETENR